MERAFSYSVSCKVSGNVCQWREYGKDVRSRPGGYKKQPEGEKPTEEERLKNLEYGDRRARAKLIDVINSQFGNMERGEMQKERGVKFLTLTYKENMQDRKRLSYEWGLFVKRLEYIQGEKVSYITVPERQKRGAFHLHSILVTGFIEMENLIAIWNKDRGLGSVDLKAVKDVSNVGRYMSKYMSKRMGEDKESNVGERKGKSKRFFKSRDMKDLSVSIRWDKEQGKEARGRFMKAVGNGVVDKREASYSDEHVGDVKFMEVALTPGKDTGNLLREFVYYSYGTDIS